MTKKIIFFSLIAIILIAAWYFLIYKPSPSIMNGAPCTINQLAGKVINGVCKAIPVQEAQLSIKI